MFLCKNVGVDSNGVFNGVLRKGNNSPLTRDQRSQNRISDGFDIPGQYPLQNDHTQFPMMDLSMN